MKATWKILGIQAEGDLITQAKYFARLEDKNGGVETEGYWTFQEPKLAVPFEQVTEDMIIGWVKDQTTVDGKNMVETRLAEQLASVNQSRPLPWAPQVFTPTFEA